MHAARRAVLSPLTTTPHLRREGARVVRVSRCVRSSCGWEGKIARARAKRWSTPGRGSGGVVRVTSLKSAPSAGKKTKGRGSKALALTNSERDAIDIDNFNNWDTITRQPTNDNV